MKGNTNSGMACVTYSGKLLLTLTLTTTAASIALNSFFSPSGSAFLGAIGDCFQFYAFHKLSFKLFPNSATAGTGYNVFGFQNEICDSAPSTATQIVDLAYSTVVSDAQTVASTFTVPRKILLGDNMEKMWRTQTPSQSFTSFGTLPSSNLWEGVQGCLWVKGTSTATIPIVLSYTVRFASALSTNMTPAPGPRVEFMLGFAHYVHNPKTDVWEVSLPVETSKPLLAMPYGILTSPGGKNCEHDFPSSTYIACYCKSPVSTT